MNRPTRIGAMDDGRGEPIRVHIDGSALAGWLHRPARHPFPVVIGVHGLLSSADSPKQLALAEACRAMRIGYLRFDQRGCGRSQGRMAQAPFAARVRDLLAVGAQARKTAGSDGRIGFFGSSLGAAVCIAAARDLDPAVMVLYAGPLKSRSIAPAALAAAPRLAGLRLAFDLSDRLAGLHHLLVIHGTADSIVPVADAEALYAAAGHPKSLWRQAGGDHPMSDPVHQTRFVSQAVDWFARGFAAGPRDLSDKSGGSDCFL